MRDSLSHFEALLHVIPVYSNCDVGQMAILVADLGVTKGHKGPLWGGGCKHSLVRVDSPAWGHNGQKATVNLSYK